MKTRTCLVLAVAAGLALPPLAMAQQTTAGTDFRVNTYTTLAQRWPEVHYRAAGDFIVSWTGINSLDGSGYGVIAQRYDAAGVSVGAEFKVNTFTPSFQYRPRMASDKKGNFVVVWSSYGQDGDYYGMFGQRFDAAANPVGTEFQVNTYTTGGQGSSFYFLIQNQHVAMSPSGNFVVVWGSYGNDQDGDGGGGSVQGQLYDASGNTVGGNFQVNTYTTGIETAPSVGMAANGSFVVAWIQPDGSSYGISGQRFGAGGNRVGAEFMVNANTTGNQLAPNIRMKEDGSFLVVWSENPGEIFGRTFDAGANPLGAEFQVNTYTTGSQYTYNVSLDKQGNFVVNWNLATDGSGVGIAGQRFTASGARRGAEFQVNTYTTGTQSMAAVASDDVGNVASVWRDAARDGSGSGVFGQRFGGLRPTALAVNTTGSGVLQPGATVDVKASWRNINGAPQTFGGALSGITGPAGATYTITDAAADYGLVANGASATCTTDCYGVSVSNPATRPVQHWDASAVETLTPDTQGQQKRWTLHIGNSFTDVTTANPFYRFVETLLHRGVTGGCGGTNYCPTNVATREQMSVFVLSAKEGAGYAPPACSPPNIFADVPETSPFCRFIEELANRGVVGGCGGGNYCPTTPVTREQMAIFVLRTLDPALSPPACAPPNLFNDVPETSPFCKWIEELANRGVVSGCGGGNYCPTGSVTREQMSVFISGTFNLTLYGL